MRAALSDQEIRAVRRKARLATLAALEALGGEARRQAIHAHAVRHGDFDGRERDAPAPEKAAHKHASRIDYELAWALTNLKRDGLVINPSRSVWALAGAAAVSLEPPLAAPVAPTRLEDLRALPYREYLRSPEWRETRGAALVRAGHACSLDVSHIEHLEVHHRTYARLGEERPQDVVVLCHDCHRHHHQLVGRPRRTEPIEPSTAPPGAGTPAALYVPTHWQPEPAPPERRSVIRRLLGREAADGGR